MTGFRHVGDEPIADLARLRVVRGTFEGPDGERFHRDVVRNQEVVAMVPLHDDGTVTLVRQYRGPIDRELLEIPAGLCDVPGEAYEDGARRELVEEVGLAADGWSWWPATTRPPASPTSSSASTSPPACTRSTTPARARRSRR